MNTDRFTIHIKSKDVYGDIADDVKKRLNTSNYTSKRRLPIGKSKKLIVLMKDELGGKIMTEFSALRLWSFRLILIQ